MQSSTESVKASSKAKSASKSKTGSSQAAKKRLDHGDERYVYISEAAYYRAQARGFEQGHELEDWLAAEAELSS